MSRLVLWLCGLAVGTVGVPLWIYAAGMLGPALWLSVLVAAVVLGLVILVVLLRPWPAGSAGLLLATGVWFVALLIAGANRCAATSGCQLGDNAPQNATAIFFVLSGIALSGYLMRTTNTKHAGSVSR